MASDRAQKWQWLCELANESKGPDGLATWLDLLATDAERLLARIATKKDSELSKTDVERWIRYAKQSTKPRTRVYELLGDALGRYRFESVAEVDRKSRKLMKRDSHPADATDDQLCAFMLLVAGNTGEWQQFRRCRDPRCRTYFYDHMPRGQRPRLYCCTNHSAAHRARMRRGVKT